QAWIKDLGIGPKTTFVVYIIRVSRIKDGASCVSAQRYSELRSLYNHLKHEGQVRSEGAPEFPGKRVVTEESFLGDRSDANSEFVRHRKEQLGSFLRQLFNKNPELWDHPDVVEFFNLEALDQGKSYAERAHTAGGVGNGVGHGLRNYDPSVASQWNPYSIAMQAAQENRTRNTDYVAHNNNDNDCRGGGGGGGEEEDAGGGIGAWFRGIGGGGGEQQEQEGRLGPQQTNGYNNDGYNNGGGASTAQGRGRGWWPGGGGTAAAAVPKAVPGSPVEVQVQALQDMGFAEDAARLALRASGYDTNLAAEYCVTGVPPERAASLAALSPAAAPAPSSSRGRKGLIGNNVVPSSGNSGGVPAWRRASAGGGTQTGAVSNGGGYGGATAARGGGGVNGVGRTTGLDWRNMPRANNGGGSGGGGGGGGGGGTVDV
ncbi:unnamed protein product, partial [Ectocarpus fasciculatus]